ncbi:unnamed protein product [Anisakis simplex]|uniref:PCM1_C domain-containing protein n=1 Tax=Anisakis simplex TaxID=6269 RepID=A0A158PNG9_ANISI|nr:unnamed protein product [Anisakis simplex]
MDRLTSIRSNKQRILETLRGLKENLAEDEEPDRELMAKMIASYDLLSAQEEEYLKIMQQIVAIRENAAEDVERDVKQEGRTDEVVETDKKSDDKSKESDDKSKDNASATPQSAQPNEQPEKVDQKKSSGGTEDEWKEVEEELKKLGNVTGEAVAASVYNEKLVETLHLSRMQKAALEEMRKEESDTKRGEANEALKQVEMARLKLLIDQDERRRILQKEGKFRRKGGKKTRSIFEHYRVKVLGVGQENCWMTKIRRGWLLDAFSADGLFVARQLMIGTDLEGIQSRIDSVQNGEHSFRGSQPFMLLTETHRRVPLALVQYKKIILVAAEQEQIERKRKTLERLRREAVRRGIVLEPGSASEPDIVVEPQPEPKSVTEAKLRAKLNAKKKQNEQEEVEDNSPPIPENLVPPERIPPIVDSADSNADNSTNANDSNVNNGHGSSKKKKKGKRAKQQDKERRDAINASVREKLAAIKARKQRMREIQAQLLKPVISESQMDETFQKAQERLKSLTAMRERLEELKESGGEVSEETVAMLEKQLVEEENATAEDDKAIEASNDIAEATNANMEPALEHIEQIVESVRSEFDKVMMSGRKGNATNFKSESDLSPGYCLSVNDSQRLKNIEESIEQQKRLLLAINNRISAHQSDSDVQSSQPALSTPPTTTQTVKSDDCQKCIHLMHQSLLTADSQVLNRFADIITKLANAQNVPELRDFLQTLFNSSEQSFPAQAASVEKEELDASKYGSDQAARVGTRNGDEQLIPIANSERIEQAKRRLSSGKAKLQKQRTLERVRCLTGDENGEETNESEPKGDDGHALKGLEKDICRIIEGVVPWIREYSETVATEKLMNELRNVILQRSAAVCFPNGSGSDLFEKQLSTIIDDTLSQYYGYKIGVDREQLIFDISEVLYNELAFFQLMYNIDCMVEYKQDVKHTDNI